MDAGLYENICREIKIEVPDIHIHGFSPEEILYGATRSNISIEEFLKRMKEAGVDTFTRNISRNIRSKTKRQNFSRKNYSKTMGRSHQSSP